MRKAVGIDGKCCIAQIHELDGLYKLFSGIGQSVPAAAIGAQNKVDLAKLIESCINADASKNRLA